MSHSANALGSESIQQDPRIRRLLDHIPKDVAESFSERQLHSLKHYLVEQKSSNHRVDIRGTGSFFRWRYYFVFQFGKNRREMTRMEQRIDRATTVLILFSFIFICTLLGLTALYLVKSALGIDLLPDHSLGLWSWFRRNIF